MATAGEQRRSALLFLALVFWSAFLATAMDWFGWNEEAIGVVLGISTLSLSWGIGRTAHTVITPFWYLVGGAFLLAVWWSLTEGTSMDLSTLGLSAALIWTSIRAASRSPLFVSVVGLLSYLSYFAYEYFADVIGWPISLILLGLVMIGVRGWAMKAGRRIGAA